MNNEHFGQGNPHSDIWFIAKDANFPSEYLDINEIGDDRVQRYESQVKERHFIGPLKPNLVPHPLFWGRLFYMKKNGRDKPVFNDGVRFWGNLLGIKYGHKSELVYDLDEEVVDVYQQDGRTGYIYDLWVTGRMYLTETVSRSTSGKEVSRSKPSDQRSLVSILNKYEPRVVVTLGGSAEGIYLDLCTKKGLQHIHLAATHPSQTNQYDIQKGRLNMKSLERDLPKI